jgi:hypothetical protein
MVISIIIIIISAEIVTNLIVVLSHHCNNPKKVHLHIYTVALSLSLSQKDFTKIPFSNFFLFFLFSYFCSRYWLKPCSKRAVIDWHERYLFPEAVAIDLVAKNIDPLRTICSMCKSRNPLSFGFYLVIKISDREVHQFRTKSGE